MPDPLDSFLRYNVQTIVWQTLSSMKHPTSYPHLLLYKTHIYGIGTDNNTMQRYNIIHNYCQQLTNPPLALSNTTAINYNNNKNIILAGKCITQIHYKLMICQYTPSLNQFSQ